MYYVCIIIVQTKFGFKNIFQISDRSTPSFRLVLIFKRIQNKLYKSTVSKTGKTTPFLIDGPCPIKMACISSTALSYPCTPYRVCGETKTKKNKKKN